MLKIIYLIFHVFPKILIEKQYKVKHGNNDSRNLPPNSPYNVNNKHYYKKHKVNKCKPLYFYRDKEKQQNLKIWIYYRKGKKQRIIKERVGGKARYKAAYYSEYHSREEIDVKLEFAPFPFQAAAHQPIKIQAEYYEYWTACVGNEYPCYYSPPLSFKDQLPAEKEVDT